MNMDNWSAEKEFLQTFRAEAEERLQNLAEGIMALEARPEDEELLKRLFREAHTLKGAAGMMGFEAIKDLSHKSEDIFSAVQKGQIQIDKETIDLLLEALDSIDALLPDTTTGEVPEKDISDLLGKLAAKGGLPSSEVSPAAQSLPGEPDIRQEAAPPRKSQDESEPAQISAQPVRKESKIQSVDKPRAGKTAHTEDPTIRVNIDRLDKLLNLSGEMVVGQIDSEAHLVELTALKDEAGKLFELFKSLIEASDRIQQAPDPERVSSINQQLHQAEERAESIFYGIDSTQAQIKENTANRRLALMDLQDRTLQVRMLPIGSIYGAFPRVVRDAAATCGKIVKLEMSGDDVELDKRMLEQIVDPLMHIIRNCVDHGIESPESRRSAGKTERGTVRISTVQQGDRVDVMIEDDGGGIDPGRVRSRAVQSGIIDKDDELSEIDIFELIFTPGFSTSDSVTDISGRGVGLDVVKNNIESLEGYVTVESEPGKGTRFTISLPVTLAVIRGLLVESNDEKFVIPLSAVREMTAADEGQIQTLGNHRGMLTRNGTIPVIDLLGFLGGISTESEHGKTYVVIVRSGKEHSLGLEVGKLLGERELVIKPLDPLLGDISNIAGVSILGNGEVVTILNTSAIARGIKNEAVIKTAARISGQISEKSELKRKKVLVVEDSLVVRELQRNILEAAGYDVDTAVDGEDALGRLSRSQVDCVVTDVEMPRMDGFDLTSALRKQDQFRDTPVIIVSSRGSENDKQRGIDVGANAYVVKGSFDQHNLLETIERLVA